MNWPTAKLGPLWVLYKMYCLKEHVDIRWFFKFLPITYIIWDSMPNFSSRVEFAFLSLCTIISMIMSNHSTIHITWTILYAEISVHSRLDTICENYPLPKLHVEALFQHIPSTVVFTLLSNLSAHSSCYFTLWHNPAFSSSNMLL